MIIDITGVQLTPGNLGKDGLGNGKHKDIDCCCDECDYLLCRINEDDQQTWLDRNDNDRSARRPK